MLTISIEDKWVDAVQLFGDVERVVKEALRAYLTEQCQQRLERAAANIETYTQKYGCDYHHFKRSVQTDEDFLTKIEAQNPCGKKTLWNGHIGLRKNKRGKTNSKLFYNVDNPCSKRIG